MDAAIVVALVTATSAVLVALIGAGWLAKRKAPAPTPDVELLRRIEVEEATSELLREQRDQARGELEEEQDARSALMATLSAERTTAAAALEAEKTSHDLTRRLLDDCVRQRSSAESDARALKRELDGVATRRTPRA